MKRQEFTIGDLGDVTNAPSLLTSINRLISLNDAYVKQIIDAKRYYENENAILQISEKRIEQKIEEVQTSPLRRADNRVPFNYHQILTDQKSAYLFGQMVLLKAQEDDSKDQNVTIDLFNDKLNELSKRLHRSLGVLSIEGSNNGHGWLYSYINEEGEFRFAVIDADEIIPIYDSTIEKRLLYCIRYYVVGKDNMIEFHAPEKIIIWKNNKFVDEKAQFTLGKVAGAWVGLPFIEFNNTPSKMDDLHKYKALIDVYDKTVSLYANDIEDMQQLIFVLINYGGTDLDVFLDDLKKYKVVNMSSEGKLETLKVEIPVEARIKLLELLDRAIWMSGQGVDPRLENMGNMSGTALKQLYGLLELKASQMESEFREAISKLIDLYKQYLQITKVGDFKEIEVDQIYTRSMISNNLEIIQMAQTSKGLISDETIIANHPWVDNVKTELDRIKAEKEVSLKQQQDIFGVNQDTNNQNVNQDPKKQTTNPKKQTTDPNKDPVGGAGVK